MLNYLTSTLNMIIKMLNFADFYLNIDIKRVTGGSNWCRQAGGRLVKNYRRRLFAQFYCGHCFWLLFHGCQLLLQPCFIMKRRLGVVQLGVQGVKKRRGIVLPQLVQFG